jgi:hypothetical protein
VVPEKDMRGNSMRVIGSTIDISEIFENGNTTLEEKRV